MSSKSIRDSVLVDEPSPQIDSRARSKLRRYWSLVAVLLAGMLLVGGIVYVAGWLQSPTAQPPSDDPQALIAAAISEFERAIELEPGNPEGYEWLAKAYLMDNRPAAALDVYRQAIEFNPGQAWPYIKLSHLYLEQGDPDQAQVALETAVELKPDFKTVYQIGRTLLSEQELMLAQPYLEQAVELDPQNLEAHLTLSRLYREQGEFDRALEALKPASILAQDQDQQGEIHHERGYVYLAQGNTAAAQVEFLQAVAIAPANGSYKLSLCNLYQWSLNKPEQGLPYCQQAANLLPGESWPHTSLGMALMATGRLNEAVQELDTAKSLSPQDGWAYLRLAHVYDRLGDYESVLEYAQEAANLASGDQNLLGEAHFTLAGVYQAQQDLSLAEVYFIKAIEAQPDNPYMINRLGDFYYWTKHQPDQAVPYLRRVTELAPTLAGPHLTLATIWLEQGQTAAGVKALQQALLLEPASEEVYQQVKARLPQTASPEQVWPYLEELIQLSPHNPQIYLVTGRLLIEMNTPEKAISIYHQALEQGLKQPPLYHALAKAYSQIGDTQQAEVYYRQANALELEATK
ncbi:MAG TPA: tetratricopeptide repeat protein [Anaerolineae bacterium]|nr:tetratricopeptide repeat protein [Anaerolineae bacterium]HMR66403.1 tetratricopeptide repeat protein [Anaerolineae bacterium]